MEVLKKAKKEDIAQAKMFDDDEYAYKYLRMKTINATILKVTAMITGSIGSVATVLSALSILIN